MVLCNEKYYIEIKYDNTYTLNSTDNKYYDFTFIVPNGSIPNYPKALSLDIQFIKEQRTISIVLVGDLYLQDTNCALLKNDEFIVLVEQYLIFIDLTNVKIVDEVNVSDFSCFGVYPFMEGYIVHGELDVVHINKNRKVEWSFSARDIFKTPDGSEIFEIIDEKIKVKDWEGYIYVLDKKGKVLEEINTNKLA